jgi:DNA-binding MarR family transcriptional regulator
MARKIFCKAIPTLKDIQQKSLLVVASKDDGYLLTQTEIANRLKVPITTLNYHITKLRAWGLITKQNELSDRGIRYIRYFKHWDKLLSKKLRAHKIQVTLFLSRMPKELNNNTFTPFTNKRYKGLKAEVKGSYVMFYPKNKAVVTLPDIYGNDSDEIAGALSNSIQQMIQVLETEFPGLKVDDYKPAKNDSMHVAILDSIFAELYLLQHKSCYKGKKIAIDGSHGRPELEVEDGTTALKDIELLVQYDDLVAENQRLKKLMQECPEMSENENKNNS